MTNSSGDCYDADAPVYQAYAIVNVILGVAVCVLGSFVLTVLFLLDKHLFYYQRLIIYLNVSVIFGGVVSVMSINPFLPDTESTFCTVNGVLFNWSILTQYIIIWWISIEAFKLSMRKISLHTESSKPSSIEVVILLVAFFLPLLFVWIPALPSINRYGPDGPLCDLVKFNYTDCKRLDEVYLIIAFYRLIPLSLSLVVFPILFLISVLKFKIDSKKRLHHLECQQQHSEVFSIKHLALQLQLYPVLYVMFSIAPLLFYVVDSHLEHYFIVYMLVIIINNLRGIVVSSMSAFDKDTRSRLTKARISNTLKRLVRFDQASHGGNYRPFSYNRSNLYTSYGDSLDGKEMKAIRKNNLMSKLV